MTLKGTFRDGVIVPDHPEALREGDVVRIVRARASSKRTVTKKPRAKAKPAPVPGFGSWKHRTDIVDTASFSRKLRRRASRGRRNG